jgi:hypothetical protein
VILARVTAGDWRHNTPDGTEPDPAGYATSHYAAQAARLWMPLTIEIEGELMGTAPAARLVAPVWLPGANTDESPGPPIVAAGATGQPGLAFLQEIDRAATEEAQPYQAVLRDLAGRLSVNGPQTEPVLLLAWYEIAGGVARSAADGRALSERQLLEEVDAAIAEVGE